jgi:hypothetical protein
LSESGEDAEYDGEDRGDLGGAVGGGAWSPDGDDVGNDCERDRSGHNSATNGTIPLSDQGSGDSAQDAEHEAGAHAGKAGVWAGGVPGPFAFEADAEADECGHGDVGQSGDVGGRHGDGSSYASGAGAGWPQAEWTLGGPARGVSGGAPGLRGHP